MQLIFKNNIHQFFKKSIKYKEKCVTIYVIKYILSIASVKKLKICCII
jgi:hypothetical protein